eukprot:4162111-Amphidinium_carterae.1
MNMFAPHPKAMGQAFVPGLAGQHAPLDATARQGLRSTQQATAVAHSRRLEHDLSKNTCSGCQCGILAPQEHIMLKGIGLHSTFVHAQSFYIPPKSMSKYIGDMFIGINLFALAIDILSASALLPMAYQ